MNFFIQDAYAQGAAGGQENPFSFLIVMTLLFVAFYFLLIRPQQKRQKAHQALVTNLQIGDEIMTAGGLLGRVKGLNDQFATIAIADNVEVKVQRQTISAVLPKGTVENA